jgi:hypothetical protein
MLAAFGIVGQGSDNDTGTTNLEIALPVLIRTSDLLIVTGTLMRIGIYEVWVLF